MLKYFQEHLKLFHPHTHFKNHLQKFIHSSSTPFLDHLHHPLITYPTQSHFSPQIPSKFKHISPIAPENTLSYTLSSNLSNYALICTKTVKNWSSQKSKIYPSHAKIPYIHCILAITIYISKNYENFHALSHSRQRTRMPISPSKPVSP